ncbi:ComEC/Rec2 family competence protein [Sphingomonas sp. 28-62-11]|uniref:ComEC/Rec2 family competence protein n=1 Tax=Sphingomonas sp. 28-62-11 TaxID=1970432 RepID=UPI000BC9C046|nr:MAG: competence protein ComEC [Sphingomonas sp. 28-62-11]
MASTASRAPSTVIAPLQTAAWRRASSFIAAAANRLEQWLEAERDQLVLWLPVMLGTGAALWFMLPDPNAWALMAGALTGVMLIALAAGRGGRATRTVSVGCAAMAIGLGLTWSRAERVASPPLARPMIVRFDARVERVDPLPSRELVRLRLAPLAIVENMGRSRAGKLPSLVRVNIATADIPAGLSRGAVVRLGARLMPPPPPSVPGAYDFARVAWFDRLGATGRGFAPITVLSPGDVDQGGLRARLSTHIRERIGGAPGAIAAALATGDQGAIPPDDAEAMRRSGLAHLLSVSGLHITAVVGAVMFVMLRLLALSPWAALHLRLPLMAAGAAALAAIGYTVLTGAEVPTIRSCVAALMVLLAIALGREAMTLRLVASGAVIVLLFWPEALAGPSFQLSFAAITAIVALHEHPRVRAWFAPRDEGRGKWLLRQLAALLMKGIVVEAALSPIALYHFHKAGLYGSLANIVAIPLTTFIIMPLEALALTLDLFGIGAPIWWLVELALQLLLMIAHAVSAVPGAVATLPSMPGGAFALIVIGGLWIALWRTRARWAGVLPLLIGAGWSLMTPPPDLLITGDGRHVALRTEEGNVALLRDRAGDYTRSMLAEASGVDGEPLLLSEQPDARCSRDLCIADRIAGGRRWRIVATRSPYRMSVDELIAACRNADIIISDRRLPRRCTPRWLRLDRPALYRTGGVSITLGSGSVRTVFQPGDRHPWLPMAGRGASNR